LRSHFSIGRSRRIVRVADARTSTSHRGLVIRTLPALVAFLAILLTMTFLVLMASLLEGIQLRNTLIGANPFTAYEVLWPGQPLNSVTAYAQGKRKGFVSCFSGQPLFNQTSPAPSTGATGSCSPPTGNGFYLDSGDDPIFQTVAVTIIDDRVSELMLFSNSLQEDAVSLYWGAPDTIALSGDNQSFELYWERSSYSANALVNKADSVVKLITITAN